MIPQLKCAVGITAIEIELNEILKNTAVAIIVLSTVVATLVFAYIYSQITHKVPYLILGKL